MPSGLLGWRTDVRVTALRRAYPGILETSAARLAQAEDVDKGIVAFVSETWPSFAEGEPSKPYKISRNLPTVLAALIRPDHPVSHRRARLADHGHDTLAAVSEPVAAGCGRPGVSDIRDQEEMESRKVMGPRFDDLRPDVRAEFLQEFTKLAEEHNPIVRRVVRRTRPMLEDRGLLKRIGVVTHPRAGDALPPYWLSGDGLEMGLAFRTAYEAAEAFSRLYAARVSGAGFLKTILLRRIGSSARAGLDTARKLLSRLDVELLPDEELGDEPMPDTAVPVDGTESQYLHEVERCLAAVVDGTDDDPKVRVVLYYLRELGWLESNGAIIFSQYRTTAEWVLEALCKVFPNEPVALYAGGTASFLQRGSERRTASREDIKRLIQNGEIRLVCATDAACEGLNLQRLGAQINIDMPWNPSRLEQRKGRVQRIGQARDNVHVLNRRYSGTVEDTVYAALSQRFGDIFSVLGQLPDSFEDDSIAAVLDGRDALRNFSQKVETTTPAMVLRNSRDVADDRALDWQYTERVLSSRDIDAWMRQGW